jgi:hypothetical protein
MVHVLTSLSPVCILVVSVVGFLFGAVWYSPFLFVKPWMEEAKITPEMWKGKPGLGPKLMVGTFVLTVISTTTLAALMATHHTSGGLKGAEFGLMVGAGLVAARHATNALFELKTLRHYLIVSGFDVALCVLQGAILGAWR